MKTNLIIFILSIIVIFSSSCFRKAYVGDSIEYDRNVCVLQQDRSKKTQCLFDRLKGFRILLTVEKIDNDTYQIQGETEQAEARDLVVKRVERRGRICHLLLINNGKVVDSIYIVPEKNFQKRFKYKEDFEAVSITMSLGSKGLNFYK